MNDLKNNEKLYSEICNSTNLFLAWQNAKKGKSKRRYIKRFQRNLKSNLLKIQQELTNQTYKHRDLKTFILRDPKIRKISKSSFKDRIIHHALYNIIVPNFENGFLTLNDNINLVERVTLEDRDMRFFVSRGGSYDTIKAIVPDDGINGHLSVQTSKGTAFYPSPLVLNWPEIAIDGFDPITIGYYERGGFCASTVDVTAVQLFVKKEGFEVGFQARSDRVCCCHVVLPAYLDEVQSAAFTVYDRNHIRGNCEFLDRGILYDTLCFSSPNCLG